MVKLPTNSHWSRWLGTLGACLLVGGMVWVGAFNYSHRNYPEAVKYELHLPWTPRLMVFLGFGLLVISAARIGIVHFLQRRK